MVTTSTSAGVNVGLSKDEPTKTDATAAKANTTADTSDVTNGAGFDEKAVENIKVHNVVRQENWGGDDFDANADTDAIHPENGKLPGTLKDPDVDPLVHDDPAYDGKYRPTTIGVQANNSIFDR